MLYTLENAEARLTVNSVGAEMMSFILKKDNTEYMWQRDAQYWASTASNLFPICGRLKEGKYTYKGQTYEMILHGFARKTDIALKTQTADTLVFRLTDTPESLKQYPFRFVLEIMYKLEGTTLSQTFHVENPDETELIFAVGAHPGYNVPLEKSETFEDYYLQFDCEKEPKALCMSDACLYLNNTIPFPLEKGGILPLKHSMFDHDAIFLTEMCKTVTLKSKKSSRQVRMTYPDMQNLGIWHKPQTEAPYVCIEPWYSTPAMDDKVDDFETKHQMIHLAGGKTYENTVTITIA